MFEALLSAAIIMSLSLLGGLFFGSRGSIEKIHTHIVPLAVGVFLGIVLFELIPETLEASQTWGSVSIAIGFLGFYLLTHILETFHHHHVDDHDACTQNGARKILIGDSIHNISDGIVIASAFIINPLVGVLTTIGIALHEIPQEIAEFGILLHAGYTKKKALIYNLISASSIFIGVFLTYLLSQSSASISFVLTGVAAGNLLYIATADLIPELRHSHREHFLRTFSITVGGLIAIALLVTYTHQLFS